MLIWRQLFNRLSVSSGNPLETKTIMRTWGCLTLRLASNSASPAENAGPSRTMTNAAFSASRSTETAALSVACGTTWKPVAAKLRTNSSWALRRFTDQHNFADHLSS